MLAGRVRGAAALSVNTDTCARCSVVVRGRGYSFPAIAPANPYCCIPRRRWQPGAPASLSTHLALCRFPTLAASTFLKPLHSAVFCNNVAWTLLLTSPAAPSPRRSPPPPAPATAAVDGSLMFWLAGRPDGQGEGCIPAAHEAAVWSAAWHPLGHVLASGGCSSSCRQHGRADGRWRTCWRRVGCRY